MDDPEFALKVRERASATLDEALRISLQLGAWQRDARRQHNDQAKPVRSRIVTSVGANASNVNDGDVLNVCDTRGATGGVDNVAVALAELTKKLENFMSQGPKQPAKDVRGDSVPKTTKGMGPNPLVCWQCGQIGHVRRIVLNRGPKLQQLGFCNRPPKHVMLRLREFLRDLIETRCIFLCNLGIRNIPVCDCTLVPEKVVASLGLSEMDTSDQRLFAANDTEIETLGRVTLPMRLLGRQILTDALVSPDIEEIMRGSDWLHGHNCLWDFKRGCIHVDGGPAIELSRQNGFRCRRVFCPAGYYASSEAAS